VTKAVRKVIREERSIARHPAADDDVFLSIAEAARLASVAAGTIRAWVNASKLRRYGAGARVLRVRRSELLEFLEREGREGDKDEASLSPEALADRDHARYRQRMGGRKRRPPGSDTYQTTRASRDEENGDAK
jgi:excisionase family DNA binding protein